MTAAIVLPDRTVLLETAHPAFGAAREALAPIAELVKTPEGVHTLRLTPLSLWNAAALGIGPDDAVARLRAHARYGVPPEVEAQVVEWSRRYGEVVLEKAGDALALKTSTPEVLCTLRTDPGVGPLLGTDGASGCRVAPADRGRLKQALAKAGWPARDRAGYDPYASLDVALAPGTSLRPYQEKAVESFFAGGPEGGSGVVCLPCGGGKTLVGLAAIARLKAQALVITSSTQAARQWVREALLKTTLGVDEISEYSAGKKKLAPVTVTTYGMLAYRPRGAPAPPHLEVFRGRSWGIVVYDEVHLLPAPVFRATAEIQAVRRLGLTATLVREDGREDDVFALVGPKREDVPWKRLEQDRFLAHARCIEVRTRLHPSIETAHALASPGESFRLASTSPSKDEVVLALLSLHEKDRVLVLGTYLDQLDRLARLARAPLITGATPEPDRERLFREFREGRLPVLVVSRVANFAIDLPDASVAIEVSGTFGSRQEEAQRLGRVLRPKSDGRGASFYQVVCRDSREVDMAARRQRFLLEQGYVYEVLEGDDLIVEAGTRPWGDA